MWCHGTRYIYGQLQLNFDDLSQHWTFLFVFCIIFVFNLGNNWALKQFIQNLSLIQFGVKTTYINNNTIDLEVKMGFSISLSYEYRNLELVVIFLWSFVKYNSGPNLLLPPTCGRSNGHKHSMDFLVRVDTMPTLTKGA